MEQDDANRPGGIHLQVPSDDTTTLVDTLLSISLSPLHSMIYTVSQKVTTFKLSVIL